MPAGQPRKLNVMKADFLLNIRAGQKVRRFVVNQALAPVGLLARHHHTAKREDEKPPPLKSGKLVRWEGSQDQPKEKNRCSAITEDREVLQQAILQCQSCCQTVAEDQALHDPRHPHRKDKPQASLLARQNGRRDLAGRRRSTMSTPCQRGTPITRENSAQRPRDKTRDSSHDADCGKQMLPGAIELTVRRL